MTIYSSGKIGDLADVVGRTALNLTSHAWEYEIIAVRGLSGQIVGIPASIILRKELVIIRKNDVEYAHSDIHPGLAEAEQNGRYIILDDFMSSGATVQAIQDEIERKRPDLRLVGRYMYESGTYDNLVAF